MPKTMIKVYIMTQTEFNQRKRCMEIGCKVPLPPEQKHDGHCEHHTTYSMDTLI